jgi:hypothetical protein
MHRSLWGTFLGCLALSCSPRAVDPTSSRATAGPDTAPDAHALVVDSLDCVLGPVVYDAPPWQKPNESAAPFGPESPSCVRAARAIHVRPWRLYRHAPDVMVDLRHEVARDTGAHPADGPLLSLLDHGMAAALEAREARVTLAREAPNLSPVAVNKVRARAMVARLDDFGRSHPTSVGAEARAIAMAIAASDFVQAGRLKPAQRPYAAEPLFTIMFGSEFSSWSPDEPAAGWSDYVAAAARMSPRGSDRVAALDNDSEPPAIGGGPSDDVQNLQTVADAAAADLRKIAAKVRSGPLRAQIERAVRDLESSEIAQDLQRQ